MCQILNVSESGYYRWLKNCNKPTKRQLLSVKIKEILEEHSDNDNYGVNRMQLALLQKGIETSRRTVYRAMKESGLLHRRHRPHGITKATTEVQEKENIIKRNFKSDEPLKKFLTDISEFQCNDGKLYISPVMDCCNGEIVVLEMYDNMKKELCIATVEQLHTRFPNLKWAILHSDRGSQYTSEAFRQTLKDYGIKQSLSGTGHCFDNARMESFFATLKKEKLYKDGAYKLNKAEVRTMIFRYVFIYYNSIRVYTANPFGMSPVKYREWMTETQAA